MINEKQDGWFTSLGNGHFTQALNLFRHNCISKFTRKAFVAPESDVKLIAALNDGNNINGFGIGVVPVRVLGAGGTGFVSDKTQA